MDPSYPIAAPPRWPEGYGADKLAALPLLGLHVSLGLTLVSPPHHGEGSCAPGHRMTMVIITLQNHSGMLNSTTCIIAVEPRHPSVQVSSKVLLGAVTDGTRHPSLCPAPLSSCVTDHPPNKRKRPTDHTSGPLPKPVSHGLQHRMSKSTCATDMHTPVDSPVVLSNATLLSL